MLEKDSFAARLKSRKFLMALLPVLAASSMFFVSLYHSDFATAQTALQALTVAVSVYLGVEGAADVVGRYQSGKVAAVNAYQTATISADDDEPAAERTIAPGNG